MEQKFTKGEMVLHKYLEKIPAMRVAAINENGFCQCEYEIDGEYIFATIDPEDLILRDDKFTETLFIVGDYVRHSYLSPSPVMIVVDDPDTGRLYGCRYLSNGIFHLAKFHVNELERINEEEVLKYELKHQAFLTSRHP